MSLGVVRTGAATIALALLLSACGPLPILLGVGVAAALGVSSGGGSHHEGGESSSPPPSTSPEPSPQPAPTSPEPAPIESAAIPLNANGVSRFLYVANASAGSVTQYQIDSTTGAITCLNSVFLASGEQPTVIAVNPAQTFLFCMTQDRIDTFAVDTKSGALTQVVTTSPTLGALPWWMAVDPSGTLVLESDAADDTVTSFVIGGNGGLTQGQQQALAAGSGTANFACTVSGGVEYCLVCGQTLGTVTTIVVEPGTGTLAIPTATAPATNPFMNTDTASATIIQISPSGSDCVVATQDITNFPPTASSVVQFTVSGGFLTEVGTRIVLPGAFPWDVEFDSSSANCYVVCDEPTGTSSAPSENPGQVFNYTVAAGVLTANATTPAATTGHSPYQLAFDATDTFGFTADANSDDIQVLKNTSGALSDVGPPTSIPALAGTPPFAPFSCVTVK